MYKIKIFSGSTAATLQDSINEWLQQHKEIVIHNSNLSGAHSDEHFKEFSFYILYSGVKEQADELIEMATTATPEQSIEVKDINPEILKASS